MPHSYTITVTPHAEGPAPISFDITNHDEILSIVAKITERAIVPAAEAAEFAVGLKMFTEVMLRHRKTPLFAELMPHIGAFMKRLKGIQPQSAEGQ